MFLRYFFTAVLVFSMVPCKQLTAESLIEAIKSNQVSKASRMIASGTNLSQVDTDGNTALIVAALRNSHLVKLLLENGADPSFINQQGFSVLHLLAGRMYIPDEPIYAYYREGFYKTAHLILETGIDIEQRTSREMTPLMLAARAGADDMIRLLINAGADTELRDESSRTALHHAIIALRPSSIRALIEAGADINARDYQGRTPLILCSEQLNDPVLTAQVARILITSKAKLDLKEDSGQSALMIAARNGNDQMERALIAAGADQSEVNQMRLFVAVHSNDFAELELLLQATDANARDDQNQTPLMMAIKERNTEMVDFLLKHGADPNSEDVNHQTPIMYASNFRNGRRSLKILKQLLDSGAKVNVRDSDGSSPLALAVETFSGEGENLIKLLLDAKADPNATYFQQPILFSAIRKREPAIVDLLLRAGANPNFEYESTTPLAIAVQTDQPEMILLLLNHQALDVSVMQKANEILRNYQDRRKDIEKKLSSNISTAEIILKRTSCDGDCPVYSVEIHSDGQVDYRGEHNVTLTGEFGSKIKPEKIHEILEKAYLSGFFDSEDTNVITPSDSGDSIITIRIEGKSYRHTSRDAELDSLARMIDRVAETHHWTTSSSEWILSHSSDASTLSTENFIRAVVEGESDIAEAFLKAGCDPNTSNQSGESVVMLSAHEGNLQILELLFKYGAYPDKRALIAAAAKDDVKTLQYLLNHGLTAHGLNLHSLAKDASGEVIDLLVAASANLNSRDENGNTPLILAAGYRNYDMVQALLRHRINPNVVNDDGISPLLAAMSDWPYTYSRWYSGTRDVHSIAELLIRAGANPNSTHVKTGKSALSIAISRRDYLLVRLLMAAGVNPNSANQNKISPLDVARQQEFSEILNLIQLSSSLQSESMNRNN